MTIVQDSNVTSVLNDDGVDSISLGEFENLPLLSLRTLKDKHGYGSWAARVIYNELFGGVLIQQLPGEGNREHLHADADECWVILEGEWEWYIEGIGSQKAIKHDIIVVKKGIKHQIKCIGNSPGIRLAITKPDVNHIYSEE